MSRQPWDARTQLTQAIFEYIEVFYNQERRHSALHYQTPVTYRLSHQTAYGEVA
jgi:transposase InsO family protein